MSSKTILLISSLLMSCSCSYPVGGIYTDKPRYAIYQLHLNPDSTFLMIEEAHITDLKVTGKWKIDENNLILKEDIEPKQKVVVVPIEDTSNVIRNDTSTRIKLLVIPERINHWKIHLEEFEPFVIKGKRIITFDNKTRKRIRLHYRK